MSSVRILKFLLVSVPVIATLSTLILKISFSSVERFYWKPGFWGDCSQCHGSKTRKVVCYDVDSESYVDDRFCEISKPKPDNVTSCTLSNCPEWAFGKWGKCMNDCQRERYVACRDDEGVIREDCLAERKPHEIETCCHFAWALHESEWEKCEIGSVYLKKSVCRRFFPKWTELVNEKNGTAVQAKFCAHLFNSHRKMFCVTRRIFMEVRSRNF